MARKPILCYLNRHTWGITYHRWRAQAGPVILAKHCKRNGCEVMVIWEAEGDKDHDSKHKD